MTQAATQITLSIADRLRDWSRQERDLAMALRGLNVVPSPPPTPISPLPQESALSIDTTSPLVVGEPTERVERAVDSILHPDTAIDGSAPVAIDPPSNVEVGMSGPYDTRHQAESVLAGGADGAPGPFDDFIAAVTNTPSTPVAPPPLPPPSRFMVRVAPVRKPHRSTKRNYDYFEELNASLATQATQRRQNNSQN